MRELKFRGLHFETRELVYGNYISTYHFDYILSTNSLPAESLPVNCFKEIVKGTVEQYTGLKDRYGVEIFEGDVLKRLSSKRKKSFTGVVRYHDREFTTVDWDSHFDNECILNFRTEFIEVIGNIHENN